MTPLYRVKNKIFLSVLLLAFIALGLNATTSNLNVATFDSGFGGYFL